MRSILLLMVLLVVPIQSVQCEPIKTDVPPYQCEGAVMVPMRAMFEWLGAQVKYEAGVIFANGQGAVVILKPGSTAATVNGAAKELSSAPQLNNGHVFVPLRFVSEAFGADVQWDGTGRTVTVKHGGREGVMSLVSAAGSADKAGGNTSVRGRAQTGGISGVALSRNRPMVVSSLPGTYVKGSSVRVAKADDGEPRDVMYRGTIPLPPGVHPQAGMMTLIPNMNVTATDDGEYTGIWSCPVYVREEKYSPLNCEKIFVLGGDRIPVGPDWFQAGPDGATVVRKEGRAVILTEGSAYLIKGKRK